MKNPRKCALLRGIGGFTFILFFIYQRYSLYALTLDGRETTRRVTFTGAVTTVFTPLRTGLEQLPLAQLAKAKDDVPVTISANARIILRIKSPLLK